MIFSLLEEAILYAGVENEFKQSGMTYLLPTNTAFNSETSTDLSYFQTHQLTQYTPSASPLAGRLLGDPYKTQKMGGQFSTSHEKTSNRMKRFCWFGNFFAHFTLYNRWILLYNEIV